MISFQISPGAGPAAHIKSLESSGRWESSGFILFGLEDPVDVLVNRLILGYRMDLITAHFVPGPDPFTNKNEGEEKGDYKGAEL